MIILQRRLPELGLGHLLARRVEGPVATGNLLRVLVDMRAGHPLGAGHEDGGLVEELVQVLEVQALCLGQKGPEEQAAGEVAHDKQDVVLPADAGDGDRGDLPDHGVEGERGHGADTDSLHAEGSAEELGGDGPRQGSAGGPEDVVEDPAEDDKGPMGAAVGRVGGEELDDDGVDEEGGGHDEGAIDLQWATTDLVDDQDGGDGAEQGQDGVDAKEEQGLGGWNADLRVDLGGEVFNGTDAGHLATGLNHHGDDHPAHVGPVAEQVPVALLLLGVLGGDLRLDQVELGHDVGVGGVAVCVEVGEVAETLVGLVVVTEPSRRLREELVV